MFMLMAIGHSCVCQTICVSVRCPCICCIPGVVECMPPGASSITLSEGISIFSHRKFIKLMFFLCSVFLIMPEVTATITTPTVTVVCSMTSSITTTVTVALTSLDLVALGQPYVVWLCHHS